MPTTFPHRMIRYAPRLTRGGSGNGRPAEPRAKGHAWDATGAEVRATMPHSGKHSAPTRIPVDQILIGGNIPAGMNVLVIMSLAYRLRSSGWDPKPIKVWHLGPQLYRIKNGRHRYFATVIAGRADVLAKVVT